MRIFSCSPRHLRNCIVLLCCFFSTSSVAEETAYEWDLGIGLTGFHLPVYPGSSQTENYLLPYPYVRFKTKYLEMNERIRGFVYQSEKLRLNLSGDFGVPVDNEENGLREGMPDLNLVLQIGPMLEVVLDGGRFQSYESRIDLPLRVAIATDFDETENIGWIFEPRYSYEKMRARKNGWAYLLSAGLRYASKEYHAYYYDVDEQFANPGRPAYAADKGYGGAFVNIVGSWRQDNIIYGVFASYQNLNGAAYEDSPLMEQNSYVSVGGGIIFRFAGN